MQLGVCGSEEEAACNVCNTSCKQHIKVIDPANARLANLQADGFHIEWYQVEGTFVTPSRRHH